MLRRTRVSPAPDIARIGAALARPGMDPRIWVSLAIIRAVNLDSQHGPFADVVLLPSQLKATARLGAAYAGPGFGLYLPVEVDDEVKVEAPSGDPAEGLVVTERMWSPAAPPPQEAIDHPTDLVLHVESGRTFRISVSGGGKLLFGGEDSAEALVLGTTLVQALKELFTQNKLMAPFGPVIADPAWISKYLTTASTNVISQRAFTER